MIGTTWRREQGLKDALLREVLKEYGYETVPLYGNETPEILEAKRQTQAFGGSRDGPVSPVQQTVDDPPVMAAAIKAKARELGADLVGIARLRPNMIDIGVDCPFDTVICLGVHERYEVVLDGPRGVEVETYDVYLRCAQIGDALGRHVRDLGWPALAHHNGGSYVQAIPRCTMPASASSASMAA